MRIVVKDDFYAFPEGTREMGLQANFDACEDKSDWHWIDAEGRESPYNDTKARVMSKLIGESVELVEADYRKFNLSYTNPKDLLHIHHDDYDYIGIVYLNTPDQYDEDDGTLFLSHTETGIDYMDEERFGNHDTYRGGTIDDYTDKDEYNLDKWTTKMFVPMKFNRLVLFEPRYYHTASRLFGDSRESGRLVEVFHMKKVV